VGEEEGNGFAIGRRCTHRKCISAALGSVPRKKDGQPGRGERKKITCGVYLDRRGRLGQSNIRLLITALLGHISHAGNMQGISRKDRNGLEDKPAWWSSCNE